MSRVCCQEDRANALKKNIKDPRCLRWTPEKCKKIIDKVSCCKEKADAERQLAKTEPTWARNDDLVTIECDGYTSHFCDVLMALNLGNTSCCIDGHVANVPMEDERL